MSALGWGCDGADAKVRGYVKAGYTGRHKGGTGEGRATLTAWWCRGFFCRWVWGYRRDGRQKLGGGVSSLKILSAGSWGPVEEECKWWVR